MEDIDVSHYVLPALLTLLVLGTFLIFVTSGGSDDETVDRPARSETPTSTRTSTTAKRSKPSNTSRTTPKPAAPASSGRFTKVQPGDTPTSIADRSGISTERLLELNPSVDPGALKPGQTLKLAR